MARIGRAAVALGLCLSIGAHWAVLQSVAWGTMVVEYSQQVPFVTALTQTFDGDHPCDLCKNISALRHSEKKDDSQQAVAIKPDLICATRRIVFLPRWIDFHFSRLKMDTILLPHSPPTPPPRSGLV